MGRFRVWAVMLASPFVLAVPFVVVAAWLAGARGVSVDRLQAAIEPIVPVPVALGFAGVLLLTRWGLRRDGLSWADVGWRKPTASDVAIGVAVGGVLWAVNEALVFPWLQTLQPSFDPTLAKVGLPGGALMLTVAATAEDTLYRGYAWVQLERRHGALVAVAATSVLYALLAPGPELPLKVWALGFGLALVALRRWRRGLWPVVVTHVMVSLGPALHHALAALDWPHAG